MTTRRGHEWIVVRASWGGPYAYARSDSPFALEHRERGTFAGTFKTLTEAQRRARELNKPAPIKAGKRGAS